MATYTKNGAGLKTMELHRKPEAQAKLNELALRTRRGADESLEDWLERRERS